MNWYASSLELWRVRADAVFQSSSLILAAPAVDVSPRPSPEMPQRMPRGTSSSGTKQAESRSSASRLLRSRHRCYCRQSRETCSASAGGSCTPRGERLPGIPPEIAAELAEHAADDQLSSREMDVLRLIGEGNANKQIADKLSIGETTVKNHISNILSKLGANDRAHAVTIALQRGIIELDVRQR